MQQETLEQERKEGGTWNHHIISPGPGIAWSCSFVDCKSQEVVAMKVFNGDDGENVDELLSAFLEVGDLHHDLRAGLDGLP